MKQAGINFPIVIADEDVQTAFGGMDALRGAGIRVPDDVSIVGYDYVPLAAWPGYGLTTIRQPVGEMAEAAMEMLGLGEARVPKSAPTTRLIMGALVERSSTLNRHTARVAQARRARPRKPALRRGIT